jgi:hypothetical protein
MIFHCAVCHTSNVSKINVKFLSCYHGKVRPHPQNVGDGLQIRGVFFYCEKKKGLGNAHPAIRRVVANILNVTPSAMGQEYFIVR